MSFVREAFQHYRTTTFISKSYIVSLKHYFSLVTFVCVSMSMTNPWAASIQNLTHTHKKKRFKTGTKGWKAKGFALLVLFSTQTWRLCIRKCKNVIYGWFCLLQCAFVLSLNTEKSVCVCVCCFDRVQRKGVNQTRASRSACGQWTEWEKGPSQVQ